MNKDIRQLDFNVNIALKKLERVKQDSFYFDLDMILDLEALKKVMEQLQEVRKVIKNDKELNYEK